MSTYVILVFSMSRLEALKQHPARYLIPNAMTVARPIIGAMGLRDARNGNWRRATKEFCVAMATDLEGNPARWLNATSKAGAIADPIADFFLRTEVLVAFAPVMNKTAFAIAAGAEIDVLRLNAEIQKIGDTPKIPKQAKLGAVVQAVGAAAFSEGMERDNTFLRSVGQVIIDTGCIMRSVAYHKLRRELL